LNCDGPFLFVPTCGGSACSNFRLTDAKTIMDDSKEVADSEPRRPPAAGMGRPKGALNKTTRAAKDAIAQAAEALGGAERLVEWVQEDKANERVFWGTIYPKLLPLQVSGEDGGPIPFQLIERKIVHPSN
jgi:hypothetical protein